VSSKRRLGFVIAALIVVSGVVFAWIAVGPSGPNLPLATLADVPLSGNTGRLDYERKVKAQAISGLRVIAIADFPQFVPS
jgi:hypothetical protein